MSDTAHPNYVPTGDLQVAEVFKEFVESELLPDLAIEAGEFWLGLGRIFHELLPENRRLLEQRDALQAQLDAWNREHAGGKWNAAEYQQFLRSINYLHPEGDSFVISTSDVDPEIAAIAGPQLVVPVSNARFALNAANARWGSLYDALYGSNVIAESRGRERTGGSQSATGPERD